MTRINCGIPPSELSDRHLLAEHREIKRLPNMVAKYPHKINDWLLATKNKKFSLGKGHVLFFLVKGRYTLRRYLQIYNECIQRKFNVTYYGTAWYIYNKYPLIFNDYTPTEEDKKIVRQRIKERS